MLKYGGPNIQKEIAIFSGKLETQE